MQAGRRPPPPNTAPFSQVERHRAPLRLREVLKAGSAQNQKSNSRLAAGSHLLRSRTLNISFWFLHSIFLWVWVARLQPCLPAEDGCANGRRLRGEPPARNEVDEDGRKARGVRRGQRPKTTFARKGLTPKGQDPKRGLVYESPVHQGVDASLDRILDPMVISVTIAQWTSNFVNFLSNPARLMISREASTEAVFPR